MKKLLLSVLALGAVACQQSAPATQSVATAAAKAVTITPGDTVRPVAHAVWPPLPAMFAARDTLTAPMREVLRRNDLSTLWESFGHYRDGQSSFEGFFGPEHYHFSLIITKATRDAANAALYHLEGKCRYFPSHSIRPFTGTLTVQRVAGLSYPGFLQTLARSEEKAADSLQGRTYTAHARLQLQEAVANNSGVFEGEGILDFYTVPNQKPGYVSVFAFEGIDERLPTRGGGVLLHGRRRNSSTGQIKPFTVSPDVQAVAPDVFKDFMIDERMGEINPKYKHLGWNDTWQNDEWWADSPKPSLNL